MLRTTRSGRSSSSTRRSSPRVRPRFSYSFGRVAAANDALAHTVFMSANLIGGFHNRLEGSRKYLFGSAAVYGENNNSKIAGAYLIRGSGASLYAPPSAPVLTTLRTDRP